MILTCLVTHNRLEYSRRTYESWRATAGGDARIVIVDNASTDGTVDWISGTGMPHLLMGENRYPGAACNAGWDVGLANWPEAALLHRSDNDIEYLPGWREEVEAQYAAFPELALLGILNLHEDGNPPGEGVEVVPRVGGNVVIPVSLFRAGMRWNEEKWAHGVDEDGPMSQTAHERGMVARLRRTVANNMAFGRFGDYPDYYRATAKARGLPNPEATV